MTYSIFKRPEISSGAYSLVSLREKDIENIRQWRNAQMNILRQHESLSTEDQQRYWSRSVVPTFEDQRPSMVLVSFIHDGVCIGYGGLVHIDWSARRAEVSFLLDPAHAADEKLYVHEFGVFLELLKELAFKDLELNRLFTETFDVRPAHTATLESHGFVREGKLRQHAIVDEKLVDSVIHGVIVAEYGGTM